MMLKGSGGTKDDVRAQVRTLALTQSNGKLSLTMYDCCVKGVPLDMTVSERCQSSMPAEQQGRLDN